MGDTATGSWTSKELGQHIRETEKPKHVSTIAVIETALYYDFTMDWPRVVKMARRNIVRHACKQLIEMNRVKHA